MKKDNLLKGAAVFGALALMAGGMLAADAAVNNSVTSSDNGNANSNWEGRGNRGAGNMAGLSDEEKAARIAERDANRTANQAAMEARRTAVEAALSAGDYDAWVAAEGANSPIVAKVTKDNFAQFVQAHSLMEQARTILSGIGLDEGAGHGMGMGMGLGGGRMMHQ
ncbi:MAG: hypothetical protein HY931_01800 [Candidatus Falkowbacteria bacterium]|nr:MAG: hypothetical protein HY931_01800 [Candidatus Falkowbacteria bacterium]